MHYPVLLSLFIANSIFFLTIKSEELFSDYYKIARGEEDIKVFGYDARHAAILTRKENQYYIMIQKVNGFHRSSQVRISSSNISILACFNYNGRDYLWAKQGTSRFSKIFSPPNFEKYVQIEFDILSFDHLRGDVLLLKNKSISIYPFSYFLGNNATILQNSNRIFRTNLSCNDILFVDGEIFCTNDFKIFTIPIPNGIGRWMANYYINRFQFALFPKRLSTMSICQVGMSKTHLELFLYILDLFIIVILVYLLRDKFQANGFRPIDLMAFRKPKNLSSINIEEELKELNNIVHQKDDSLQK